MKKPGVSKASRHRSSSRNESPNSGTGAGNPRQNAQAHHRTQTRTSSRVEVDGTPVLVARRHHLHGESYKKVCEADLRQGASLKDPARSSLEPRRNNAARSTSPKEQTLTRPPSRRSFASGALNQFGKSKPSKKAKSEPIPPHRAVG